MALLLVGDSVGDTPIENTQYDPKKNGSVNSGYLQHGDMRNDD